jgi:hypothetical protein
MNTVTLHKKDGSTVQVTWSEAMALLRSGKAKVRTDLSLEGTEA